MMTKEEIAEIVSYGAEHEASYKRRLEELGIEPWKTDRRNPGMPLGQ